MRRIVATLLTFALFVPVPVSADHGGVHISEILPAPADGEREFVEVWNDGPAVELAGWTLRDTANNTFTFPAQTLPSGGRLVVWGGGATDARGPAWTKASVWNNGGDQVLLADAAGNTIDVFAYGSATWPDGRSAPVPSTPAAGRSLSLVGADWLDTAPTPGASTPRGGGSASASVQDVPPTATLTGPAEAQAGATIVVRVEASDGNGDNVTWTLRGDGAVLATGFAGDHTVQLAAPSDRDAWLLSLDAQDPAGHRTEVTHTVQLRLAGLVILMPAEGLVFPAFPPGAQEVVTNASFTLRNDATEPVTPRIDISDLTGPGTIPVQGRLDIGNTTWTPYDGPLTTLPTLQPGESVDLRLRLRDIPTPLAAGAYGTSFTVIA